MEPEEAAPAALAVDVEALAAALGVRVESDGADPPTYRFRQRVAFADTLQRRGALDVATGRFRSTLWAGDHRCLDHVELASLQAITCDPAGGRLTIDGLAMRLVLTRQGALSAVPLDEGTARVQRRAGRSAAPGLDEGSPAAAAPGP